MNMSSKGCYLQKVSGTFISMSVNNGSPRISERERERERARARAIAFKRQIINFLAIPWQAHDIRLDEMLSMSLGFA